MADELNLSKQPKTKTIGHIDVAKLEALPEWKAFAKHAETAKKANEAHEKAKETMREVFKTRLSLNAKTDLEFSQTGDRVTVIEILERPKAKRARASDMSDRF